jgi:hypothetical protein
LPLWVILVGAGGKQKSSLEIQIRKNQVFVIH